MTTYLTPTAETQNIRTSAIKLHGPEGFAGMRKAGRLAAEILDAIVPLVVPGAKTSEIDDFIRQMMLDAGAVPATLGYHGYGYSCCIGHAIQTYAERHRYGVVRDFCGHGLGRVFHDAPEVIHVGRPGTGPELRPGMIFTIEPMINGGKPTVKMLEDGWTAVTRDRSLSAQFEHSIGITEDGCEIFTLSPKGLHHPPY